MDKEVKFLVTKELGKLAKWLRILGFDTSYSISSQKSRIIISSLREGRIILTKNKRIGSRVGVCFVLIKNDFIKEQLQQIIRELKLIVDKDRFFSRCVLCNQALIAIDKQNVKSKVPEYVYNTQTVFSECVKCGRVYWKGTHWGNAEEILSEVLGENII